MVGNLGPNASLKILCVVVVLRKPESTVHATSVAAGGRAEKIRNLSDLASRCRVCESERVHAVSNHGWLQCL